MSRIEQLEKRLAADPNSRIFVQLAEEYRKQGLLDNAIEVCEEGLKKHPQYPSARVALGRALLEAETYDRASQEFETVLAQVPDNILANKFLGETYHRLGRLEEAIQKYQVAQTLAPEDTELEERIAAVKAEIAGGGASRPAALVADETASPDAADETTPADPAEYASAVPAAPPPPAPAPPQPEPLEPTLQEPMPAIPQGEPEGVEGDETPRAAPEDDLAPIPLVDVDGPMVLEGPAYSAANRSEEPPPVEPSPEEPPPMEPPPMEPPPMEPPPMEPPPMESPPLEPPMMEPPPMEPPMIDSAPMTAPPSSEPPSTDAPGEDEGIETPTMAELYASQGHFDKAVLVYRNLLARNPNETQYLERIEELEMLAKASQDSSAASPDMVSERRGGGGAPEGAREKTIEVLEQWLDAIRRSRGA